MKNIAEWLTIEEEDGQLIVRISYGAHRSAWMVYDMGMEQNYSLYDLGEAEMTLRMLPYIKYEKPKPPKRTVAKSLGLRRPK